MRYLIVGGTGTLGKELIQRLYDGHEIHVLSRDEHKQVQMKKVYPKIKFILGDIRNIQDLSFPFSVYDIVFHCAALKHVDIGEANVGQFIQTNLQGTINVSQRCLEDNARLIFFSTDKAVLPINAYGMSKGLAEKYLQATNPDHITFRWGNILGSRGSIVPFFKQLIENGGQVPLTHLEMTRFWLTIHEVVDFVMSRCQDSDIKAPLIPPVKSAKVMDLALCIGKILDKPVLFKEIGIRPGEKIHEHLYSDHDYCIRSDSCAQYSMDDLEVKLRQVMS